MSEWWTLVAAYWFWYFADCLKAGLAPRFLLRGAWGRGRTAAAHSSAALTRLTPLAWHVTACDPPLAFSPEGLANTPVGSAGRPSPAPETAQALRWEDIRELAQKRGRIYLNRLPFCPVTPFTTPAALHALIEGARQRTGDARARWLAAQLAAWFRPAHLARRRRRFLRRTAALALTAAFSLVLSVLLSCLVLFGPPSWFGSAGSELTGRLLPLLGWYALGLHLLLVALGWIAHRKLLPRRGEARFSLLFGAALLPPQALRLRARIGAEYLGSAHPLAWIAATARADDFTRHARHTLADLRWPAPPLHDPQPALRETICSWMRAQLTPHVENLLALRGLSTETLLAPPRADSPASCAYCPRCLSQFSSATGRCPHGIALLPLKK